ncbi:MAG: G:T/U-mismatch repair DNA glycosylase [Glaciecola sp.]
MLEKDVDFCYGSCYNSLWLFIDKIHNLRLHFDNAQEAIDQRKAYLIKHNIGVCDIVESAERTKIDAPDIGMQNIQLRDVMSYLKQYPNIDTLLFIGGNSKNGSEYFFRKHLRDYNLKLQLVSKETPKVHEFELDCHSERSEESLGERNINNEIWQSLRAFWNDKRVIKTVSLTSPSGAANISISRNPLYKHLKAKNSNFNMFDFRVLQYREFF